MPMLTILAHSAQLPVYVPSKEEQSDPQLYASNVRRRMVRESFKDRQSGGDLHMMHMNPCRRWSLLPGLATPMPPMRTRSGSWRFLGGGLAWTRKRSDAEAVDAVLNRGNIIQRSL